MSIQYDAARLDEAKKLKGTESSQSAESIKEKEQEELKSTDIYTYSGTENTNWGNTDGFERISVDDEDENELLNEVIAENKTAEGEEAVDGAEDAIKGAEDKEKEAEEV